MTLLYVLVCKQNCAFSSTFITLLLLFWEEISVGGPASPDTSYAVQASLKLNAVRLSGLPKCWAYKWEPQRPIVPLFYSDSPFYLHRKLWEKNNIVNLIVFGYKPKPATFLPFTFLYILMLQGASIGWFSHSSGLNWDIQLAILVSRRFCFPGLPKLCPLATISSPISHFPAYFSCNIFRAGARTKNFMNAKHHLFHWATSVSKKNFSKNQTKCDWGLLSELLKQLSYCWCSTTSSYNLDMGPDISLSFGHGFPGS